MSFTPTAPGLQHEVMQGKRNRTPGCHSQQHKAGILTRDRRNSTARQTKLPTATIQVHPTISIRQDQAPAELIQAQTQQQEHREGTGSRAGLTQTQMNDPKAALGYFLP